MGQGFGWTGRLGNSITPLKVWPIWRQFRQLTSALGLWNSHHLVLTWHSLTIRMLKFQQNTNFSQDCCGQKNLHPISAAPIFSVSFVLNQIPTVQAAMAPGSVAWHSLIADPKFPNDVSHGFLWQPKAMESIEFPWDPMSIFIRPVIRSG